MGNVVYGLRNFALLVISCLLLFGCAKKNPYGLTGFQGPYGILFDDSVPVNQRDTFIGDLEIISALQIPRNMDQYATYMGTSDFQPSTLTSWLEKRTKLVVGESFDYENAMQPGERVQFTPEIISIEREQLGAVQTVMFNLGAFVYLQGKSKSTIYNLAVSGNNVPIKTPRIGIIQVGEGMFDNNSIKSSPLTSMANRLLRAAVFFHEARHTDGNGAHACFPHSKCTSGDYSGSNSCEGNLNGPYVVEALVLRAFYDSCTQCNTTEQNSLRAFISDNIGRLQSGATFKDERAEGLP